MKKLKKVISPPHNSPQILKSEKSIFSNFSCMFLSSNYFSNLTFNCSNLLDLRNLKEQVKKAFRYQKLFWPFTVWINCSSDIKNFENSRLSASNFKSFSRSLEQFFLTVGQNNFCNKIPLSHINIHPLRNIFIFFFQFGFVPSIIKEKKSVKKPLVFFKKEIES